jgi:hypothetical protein
MSTIKNKQVREIGEYVRIISDPLITNDWAPLAKTCIGCIGQITAVSLPSYQINLDNGTYNWFEEDFVQNIIIIKV